MSAVMGVVAVCDPAARLTTRHHLGRVIDGAEERVERLVSWAREGLEAGDRMVCVEPVGAQVPFLRSLDEQGIDWRPLHRDGQLVVLSPEEAQLAGAPFRAEQWAAQQVRFVEESIAAGYPAVRRATDTSALLATRTGREDLLASEACLEALTTSHPMSALCLYDRDLIGADLVTCAAAHPRAVADRQGQAEVEPGRVRLGGEIDVANADLLGAVLDGAQPVGGQLIVDAAGLSFIDLAGTERLVGLARRLGPATVVRVVASPSSLGRILRAVGWAAELHLDPGT